MDGFFGRDTELKRLGEFIAKPTSSFIVIKGRRRVGKSTLIERFGLRFSKFFSFSGLAIEDSITAQDQRNEFCRQFSQHFNGPPPNYNNWGDIFWALAERVRKGRTLLLLDEISWMAHEDATFLPKLKDAWDRFYKKNPKLILIVCGSASSWKRFKA